MTVIADYANLYETVIRPRRRGGLRRIALWLVWTGLLIVRPRLALAIRRERIVGLG